MNATLIKLCFAGCIIFLLSCNTRSVTIDGIAKNEEGVKHMNAGDYDLALKSFSEAITDTRITKDTRGTIYRNLALTFSELDNTDSSLHYSTLAAKCFPKNTYNWLLNMADVELMTGRVAAAVDKFLRAAKIDPDDGAVNNSLGLIFMGEYDDDHIDLEKALVYNKKAFELSHDRATEDVLGRNYYMLEDYDNAELHYDHLLELYPGIITYPYYSGLIKHKLKKTKEAEVLFERTISMDSTYKEYIDNFKAGK